MPTLRLPRPLLCALAAAPLAAPAAPEAEFEEVYSHLEIKLPVQIAVPPDGSGRRFLVEQRGVIRLLPEPGNSGDAPVWFDISTRPLIDNAFEEGLLNLTFHPEFADNRRFFVYHTVQNPKRTRVTEFQVDATGGVDFDTERVLMEIPQPFWNHNSGNMLFGPDGFLYIAVGDGGKANDVARLAQNKFVLNGKILRIDVDGRDGDLEYAIPADNPFADTEGVRPEIFALGLRNPWGIHIDDEGRFWCADVGQNLWEEIDLIVPGGNYGWSYREGAHPFDLRHDPPPPDAEFIEPIHEYFHSDGLSITGGVVYRGKANPSLQGYYLYGDYRFGTVWALKTDGEKATENHVLRGPTPDGKFMPTAFCEDVDNEVFVLSWDGKIYRLK